MFISNPNFLMFCLIANLGKLIILSELFYSVYLLHPISSFHLFIHPLSMDSITKKGVSLYVRQDQCYMMSCLQGLFLQVIDNVIILLIGRKIAIVCFQQMDADPGTFLKNQSPALCKFILSQKILVSTSELAGPSFQQLYITLLFEETERKFSILFWAVSITVEMIY